MPKTKIREITIYEKQGTFSFLKEKSVSKQDYDFEGISILRNLLSNEKARLLHTIKNQNPGSIYSLAKILGRDFKSVMQDIKLLQRVGFIELIAEKTKNRTRHKPIISVDTMTINLKI